MILRRLYKQNLEEVYKSNLKIMQNEDLAGNNIDRYNDSMQILNMDKNELSAFMGVSSHQSKQNLIYFNFNSFLENLRKQFEDDLLKFDTELSKGDNINPNKILNLVNEVIDDRVHAPNPKQ